MINIEALFKVSYGLYIVCSGDKDQGNGFISNTFFQVTASPPRFASCCNKDNYTADFIKKTGAFSVSVLHQESPADIFGRFGYKSGRDMDKMEGLHQDILKRSQIKHSLWNRLSKLTDMWIQDIKREMWLSSSK